MSRDVGKLHADIAHIAGLELVGLLQVDSANLVLTRNAAFDWSWNRTSAGAETYHILARLPGLRRMLEAIFFSEQFGPASGAPGPAFGPGALPGPMGAPGAPPYLGATQLVPPTAPVPKGLQITDITVIYKVGVAALTSIALALDKVVYVNNTALAKTSLPLTTTALAAAVGTQTNPYVIASPVITPVFVNDDNSDVEAELTVVMASTGTFALYGIVFHVNFNYN